MSARDRNTRILGIVLAVAFVAACVYGWMVT
jgi:hypothetical protein